MTRSTKMVVDAMADCLEGWLDKQRHNVVWLHKMDIDQLREWGHSLAQHADAADKIQQPNEGWTPAEPWTKPGDPPG